MAEALRPDRSLDCIGLYCPIPVLKVREEMDKLEAGQTLEVLADDPAAEDDITRLAKRMGYTLLKLEKTGGQLQFLIRKGQPPTGTTPF